VDYTNVNQNMGQGAFLCKHGKELYSSWCTISLKLDYF